MADRFDWPFFDTCHWEWATRLEAWAAAYLTETEHGDIDAACRDLVAPEGASDAQKVIIEDRPWRTWR